MNPAITLGAVALILATAAILPHLLPARGRHSKTLGPAHTGADNGPGPEIEYGQPLDTPAARAALVDHAAELRRAAIDAVLTRDLDHGAELNRWAARLEALLKRWDIHHIDA